MSVTLEEERSTNNCSEEMLHSGSGMKNFLFFLFVFLEYTFTDTMTYTSAHGPFRRGEMAGHWGLLLRASYVACQFLFVENVVPKRCLS